MGSGEGSSDGPRVEEGKKEGGLVVVGKSVGGCDGGTEGATVKVGENEGAMEGTMEGEADLEGRFVEELEVVGTHDTEGCGDCDGATDCICPAVDIHVVDAHK